MQTDRKLLELAAKAAGAEMSDYPDRTPNNWTLEGTDGIWRPWDPLNDDAHALRLAVKLSLHVKICRNLTMVEIREVGDGLEERHKGDPLAATRRAIVRAAAAMGAQQ